MLLPSKAGTYRTGSVISILFLSDDNEIVSGPAGCGKTSLVLSSLIKICTDRGSALYFYPEAHGCALAESGPGITTFPLNNPEDLLTNGMLAALERGNAASPFVLTARQASAGLPWRIWQGIVHARTGKEHAVPIRLVVECGDGQVLGSLTEDYAPLLIHGPNVGVYLTLVTQEYLAVPPAFRCRMNHIRNVNAVGKWAYEYCSMEPQEYIRTFPPDVQQQLREILPAQYDVR